MNHDTLQEIFVGQLRDTYDAEKQLVKALPKVAKASAEEELAAALRAHLEETQEQVARLERIFNMLGLTPKGKPCQGMKGLIAEANESLTEMEKGVERDLTIIAAAQRVEHYEIAAYGTLCAIAEQMEQTEALELLNQTKEEEETADSKLTEIAMMLYGLEEEEDEEEEISEEPEMAQVRTSRGTGSTRK